MRRPSPLHLEIMKTLETIKPGEIHKENRVKALLQNETEYKWDIRGQNKIYAPKNSEYALKVLGEAIANSKIEKFECRNFINFKTLAPFLKKSKIKILILNKFYSKDTNSEAENYEEAKTIVNNLPQEMHNLQLSGFQSTITVYEPFISILPTLHLHTLNIIFGTQHAYDENIVDRLSQTLPETLISHLEISNSDITSTSLDNLAINLNRSKIISLNLSHNFHHNFGVGVGKHYDTKLIGSLITLIERTPQLSELILNHADFTDDEITNLLEVIKHSNLKHLEYKTYKKVMAFGDALPNLPLQSLDIMHSAFLKKDAVLFSKNIKSSSLSIIKTDCIQINNAAIINQAVEGNVEYQKQLHLNARDVLNPYLVDDTITLIESYITLNPDLKPSSSDILKPTFKAHQQKKQKVVSDDYTKKYSTTKKKK